jgi:hypothetical protein
VLEWIINNGAKEDLAAFLGGTATRADLRRAIRAGRATSGNYRKRMYKRAQDAGHRDLADKVFSTDTPAPAVAHTRRDLRVILHLGLPKTGTSSIQAHFYANAAAYRAAGVHYPTQPLDMRSVNHGWMSRDLRTAANADVLIEVLNATPENCDTIIISDESQYAEMPGLSQEAQDVARAALAPHKVELVLFDRDLDAWKRSFYMQSIQNRRTKKLFAHETALNLWQTPLTYDAFFETEYCKALTDFDRMETMLATCFGAATSARLRFEKGKDSIDTFCDALGIARLGDDLPVHKNPSITDCEAEILRQANALGNPHAWLIKNVIELPPHLPADKVRKPRAARIAGAAGTFPWDRLQMQDNGPLRLSEPEFTETVDRLRARAMEFTTLTEV